MRKNGVKKFGAVLFSLTILAACGMNLIPSKDEWYMKHYFIMQDFERTIYKDLSDQGRVEFQERFWEARSPESKQKFNQRIETALKVFKKENSSQPWNCDRARILLLNGNPANIEYMQNDNWMASSTSNRNDAGSVNERDNENIEARTAEVWTYQHGQFIIKYVFNFVAPKRWQLAKVADAGNRYLGAFEKENKEKTFAINDVEEYVKKIGGLEKKK
ncbi:MAG: GWxTD domain-containing protein [Acidobacteria bacterium]|nr:GWxTD domain-containing protein [Acidobacteriota bacterium]MBU4329694.1 GWxTD domain-containing protein [Acidobacteriota bacterium]MCG2815034.1 GWxTD domain-containing protein [Candidatus Aminicenantes bacterium]